MRVLQASSTGRAQFFTWQKRDAGELPRTRSHVRDPVMFTVGGNSVVACGIIALLIDGSRACLKQKHQQNASVVILLLEVRCGVGALTGAGDCCHG